MRRVTGRVRECGSEAEVREPRCAVKIDEYIRAFQIVMGESEGVDKGEVGDDVLDL